MSLTTTKWPDSTLDIEVQATEVERDDGERVNREVFLKTRTTIMFRHHLNLSLINLDHYFQPPADLFADYPPRQEVNGNTVHIDYDRYEFVFDVYVGELKEAIECRGGEDNREPAAVAGEWLELARDADHVGRAMEACLKEVRDQLVREVEA